MQQLIDKFSLRLVALTRGAAGAVLLSESGERSDLPGQPTIVVDTVGAGDSFTAALVIGLLGGLPLATINAWGNCVAAFVSLNRERRSFSRPSASALRVVVVLRLFWTRSLRLMASGEDSAKRQVDARTAGTRFFFDPMLPITLRIALIERNCRMQVSGEQVSRSVALVIQDEDSFFTQTQRSQDRSCAQARARRRCAVPCCPGGPGSSSSRTLLKSVPATTSMRLLISSNACVQANGFNFNTLRYVAIFAAFTVPCNQTRLRVSAAPNNNALRSPRNFINQFTHHDKRRLRKRETGQVEHLSVSHEDRFKPLVR